MAEPLVVVIPHKLGQAEATRRIRDGIGRARSESTEIPLVVASERGIASSL